MNTEELREKRSALFWWLSPRKDDNYQWWFGYQKVRMNILPDSEKQAYLRKQNESKD
jgi:hypothetical protein